MKSKAKNTSAVFIGVTSWSRVMGAFSNDAGINSSVHGRPWWSAKEVIDVGHLQAPQYRCRDSEHPLVSLVLLGTKSLLSCVRCRRLAPCLNRILRSIVIHGKGQD
jgi:hypothetical protein